jgi:hypothetical protein
VLRCNAIDITGTRPRSRPREERDMDEPTRSATAMSMGQPHAMEAIAPTNAMQRAENEGWPPGRLPAAGRPGFASRVAAFLRSEARFLSSDAEMTLAQLHDRLLTVAARDRAARAQLDKLLVLMAIDIGDAQRFPSLGLSADSARPMSAWRERYAGIDRYLD